MSTGGVAVNAAGLEPAGADTTRRPEQECGVPTAKLLPCGVGASSSTARYQRDDGGASPTAPLQPKDLVVGPISHRVAAEFVRARHYLHAPASAVRLSLGVFGGGELLGVAIFNPGPRNGHRLLRGATQADMLHLARFWMDDRAPRNGESRALGIIARHLRRHTAVKALLAYSDPAAGHSGTIYRGAGWLFLGHADAQPLMSVNGGPPRHLRSVASVLQSHSAEYLRRHGFDVTMVPTTPKLRYLLVLDPVWRDRLLVEPLPYAAVGGAPR